MITDAVYDLLVALLGYTFEGDCDSGSTKITNIADTGKISINDVVIGIGIQPGTVVTAKTGNTITLSLALSANADFATFFAHKDNLYLGFQNNWVPPQDNNYLTITELDTTDNGLPERDYSVAKEIQTYISAAISMIQLDFYGEYARNSARYLRTALRSPVATNILSSYDCSVYQVKEIQNLSEALDYGEYVPRFTLRFSLFNNSVFVWKDYATDQIANDLHLVEI
jgi:hypothetical protein